jgi:hypothetical protein
VVDASLPDEPPPDEPLPDEPPSDEPPSDEPLPELLLPEPPLASPPVVGAGVDDPPSASAALWLDALPAVDPPRLALASFFAHPDPLNTIAGVDMSLRMEPPQTSHAFGPDPLTPCTTSMVRPQDSQV